MTPEGFRTLITEATKGGEYSQYYLLLNVCITVVENAPQSAQECTKENVKKLLNQGLEKLFDVLVITGDIGTFKLHLEEAEKRITTVPPEVEHQPERKTG